MDGRESCLLCLHDDCCGLCGHSGISYCLQQTSVDGRRAVYCVDMMTVVVFVVTVESATVSSRLVWMEEELSIVLT